MTGMKELSLNEMKVIKGGKCSLDYGYFFCCPSNKTQLQEKVGTYLKVSQEKASKYIQFCYEVCGYR